MASKGAQICLLVRNRSDPLLLDFIQVLRDATKNQLIYAETCDLASLDSVRAFAQMWNEVKEPRRIDGIVCTAGYLGSESLLTEDGIEAHWQINYLSHFLLLNLLLPGITSQPADRNVRIVMHTCSSYLVSPSFPPKQTDLTTKTKQDAWSSHGSAKLAVLTFTKELQRLVEKIRDGKSASVRVFCVNPGTTRTASTRGHWTRNGQRVWASILYIVCWPLLWLLVKSPSEGAQTALFMMYSPRGEKDGGGFFVDCEEVVKPKRKEIEDEAIAKQLWDNSVALCQLQAKNAKKAAEKAAKSKKAEAKQQANDIATDKSKKEA